MEIKGKLTSKLKPESGTSKAGKEWTKQTIVIDNGAQYNPMVAISFFGDDKVKMLEKYQEGQEVSVGINLSSREHGGKWYNQIDGWKISEGDVAPDGVGVADEQSDDLPF